MPYARQAALVAVFFAGFYLLELGLSYLLFPERNDVLDTYYASNTIYSTEPRLAVFGRTPLARPGKQIVLVGASTVRDGLRPGQLEGYLPGVRVQNISVPAADLRELRELVELVLDAVPRSRRRDLTIVLGIWYGSFVDESRRWKSGKSDVAAEMLRYGLYEDNGDGLPAPVFGDKTMRYAISAARPLMLSSRLFGMTREGADIVDDLHRKANALLDQKDPLTGNRDLRVLTTFQRQETIAYWKDYMGPTEEWTDSGPDKLYSIASLISSAGAKLVLVDLPLPAWHRALVPYDRIYQQRLRPYLARMSLLPGFSYGSMRDVFADEDFYDSAHPRPKVTWRWAELVARMIGQAAPVGYGRRVGTAALTEVVSARLGSVVVSHSSVDAGNGSALNGRTSVASVE